MKIGKQNYSAIIMCLYNKKSERRVTEAEQKDVYYCEIYSFRVVDETAVFNDALLYRNITVRSGNKQVLFFAFWKLKLFC